MLHVTFVSMIIISIVDFYSFGSHYHSVVFDLYSMTHICHRLILYSSSVTVVAFIEPLLSIMVVHIRQYIC